MIKKDTSNPLHLFPHPKMVQKWHQNGIMPLKGAAIYEHSQGLNIRSITVLQVRQTLNCMARAANWLKTLPFFSSMEKVTAHRLRYPTSQNTFLQFPLQLGLTEQILKETLSTAKYRWVTKNSWYKLKTKRERKRIHMHKCVFIPLTLTIFSMWCGFSPRCLTSCSY